MLAVLEVPSRFILDPFGRVTLSEQLGTS